jgi:hypothetical protein
MKPPALVHQAIAWIVGKITYEQLDRFVDWFNWKIAPPAVIISLVLLGSYLLWCAIRYVQ